jgi:RHS repeat-associated protein
VWRWDQAEPFGNNPADEDPDANSVAFDLPLRLPGQRYDAETGLHYNYFRDYDPSIGGYGESDPIGLVAGPNTYAYVGQSPIEASDELGLFVGDPSKFSKFVRPGLANPTTAALSGSFLAGLAVGTAIYDKYGQEIQDALENICRPEDSRKRKHRGRIQAQGSIIKPVVNESSPWAQDTPLTKAEGFAHLHRVTMMIPYRQLPRFTNAIGRAARFISNTSTVGPGMWPFTNDAALSNVRNADRIDIDVWAGEAF